MADDKDSNVNFASGNSSVQLDLPTRASGQITPEAARHFLEHWDEELARVEAYRGSPVSEKELK